MQPFGGQKISHVGCRTATLKRIHHTTLSGVCFKQTPQHVFKVLFSSPSESFQTPLLRPRQPVDLIAMNTAPASRKEEPSETQCHRCDHSGTAITQLSVHKIASADVYLAEKHVCSFVIKVAPTCRVENSSRHAGSSTAVQENSWRCTCSTAPLKSSQHKKLFSFLFFLSPSATCGKHFAQKKSLSDTLSDRFVILLMPVIKSDLLACETKPKHFTFFPAVSKVASLGIHHGDFHKW